MEKKRKIALASAALILLACLMLVIWLTAGREGGAEGSKLVTVEVLHGDGSEKTFSFSTDAEFLGQLLLSEGLAEGEQGEFGLYILTVDGERAVYEEDGAYWALYQNGEYAVSGADTIPIRDGDVYRLEYAG